MNKRKILNSDYSTYILKENTTKDKRMLRVFSFFLLFFFI